MNTRQTIYDQVAAVAAQQHKTLPPLSDEMTLSESGLDSLCLAIIVANLDDSLNVNPFDDDDASIPITLGDLVQLYEHATVPVR